MFYCSLECGYGYTELRFEIPKSFQRVANNLHGNRTYYAGLSDQIVDNITWVHSAKFFYLVWFKNLVKLKLFEVQ